MATEERERYYNEAIKMDIKDIRKKLDLDECKNDLEEKVYRLVLQNKGVEENRYIARESIKIASQNAKSTKNLVIVTLVLVIVTFFSILFRGCIQCGKRGHGAEISKLR